MKFMSQFALINALCFSFSPVMADSVLGNANRYDNSNQQINANTGKIAEYLANLGSYLGYDITQNPKKNNRTPISQGLLFPQLAQLTETYLFSTFFGSIPVSNNSPFQFVSNNASGAQTINAWANATFKSYNSVNNQGNVTANQAIDQLANQGYEPDPVSQTLLNILSTPDASYCIDQNSGKLKNPCALGSSTIIPNIQVTNNVIGSIPNPQTFFSSNYNQTLLNQLNSNSLIAPLYFDTTNSSNTSTSSGSTANGNQGLTAQNQAQQAANFIRYVSGTVTPVNLPKKQDYDKLYVLATQSNPANPPAQQINAQAALSTYFANLRTYAAQSSVGISNLYYILSRRLPQNPTGDAQNASSQAQNEFTMASWRLFNSGSSGNQTPNKQWIEGINSASPATVQKEIAVLLAEMNYQMYLDRQIQERLLLTNSVMLMQNTKASQPTADFSNQDTGNND